MRITLELSSKDTIQDYELFYEQLKELFDPKSYKITVIAEPIND